MIILLNLLLFLALCIGGEHYISKVGQGMHQVSKISFFRSFARIMSAVGAPSMSVPGQCDLD
jgi:hypothetical protein